MQTAGIEKPLEKPITDGLITSEGSQTSTPPATVDPSSNLANSWAELTEKEQTEVRDSMERMGIRVRRARQILRAYGGGKYLRRGIGAALALNFEFTSLEEAERALRWTRKQYKNKDLPIRERVEAVKVIASLTESIRRLCESSLSMAEKFDLAEKPPEKKPAPSLNVGVNINNFPPVANIPARANGGALRADQSSQGEERAL